MSNPSADPRSLTAAPTTTVLVAEDDPITRQLLKRFLQNKGHQVLLAADGEQAWSLYCEHQPRLIVSDWRMPRLDGLELCRRIREQENDDYTYMLILTSTTDREAMVQGFAAGADDFMTKPFNREELEWRIYSGFRVIGLHETLESRIRELDEARSHLELANRQMQQGLNAAAQTQQSLLPKSAPDVANVNCAWSYEPSDHLGGDSLNLFRLTDERIGFFIADVCGHGLPSALLAVSLHRVLTPVLGQAGLLNGDDDENPLDFFSNPGRVLTEVNRRFPMKIENGEYFTAVYGVIDTAEGVLHYAGAGHPNPLLLSDHQPIRRLMTEGFPIGFDDQAEYRTESVSLNPGDRLYFYSDGVVECQNPDGEMFGIERLAETLAEMKQLSVSEVIRRMVKVRADWEQGQEDDISMILLEFIGVPAPSCPTNVDLVGVGESDPGDNK